MPDSRNSRRRSRTETDRAGASSPRRDNHAGAPEPEDELERTTVFARPPLRLRTSASDGVAEDTADTGRLRTPPAAREHGLDDTGRFGPATGPAGTDEADHTQAFMRVAAPDSEDDDASSATGRLRTPAAADDRFERTRVYGRPPLQGNGPTESADDTVDGTALFRALPAEQDWHARTAVFSPDSAGRSDPTAARERRERRRLEATLEETRAALESALETLAERDVAISGHELTQREQREKLEAAETRQRELELELQHSFDECAALRLRVDELTQQDAVAELAELQRRHARQAEALQDLQHYVDTRRERWHEQANELMAERVRNAELLRELEQRRADRTRLADELGRALDELDRMRRTPPWAGAMRPGRTLEVKLPDGSVRVFPLEKAVITIGRTGSNDVQVPAMYISRSHARVICNGDVCRIEDANSRNGVNVNGQRVTSRALRDGDRVMLGETPMIYRERGR